MKGDKIHHCNIQSHLLCSSGHDVVLQRPVLSRHAGAAQYVLVFDRVIVNYGDDYLESGGIYLYV